ncbi:hypothetical protein LTS08_001265 [Lithohypha guttulata]|nr:hypothetical protein LTS08_001265 [Lithohypha guttulata]
MRTCNTCLRRALQNLAFDASPTALFVDFQKSVTTSSNLVTRRKVTQAFSGSRRNHATLASLNRGHHRRDLIRLNAGSKKKLSPLGAKRRKEPWPLTKSERQDALARDRNRAALRSERAEEEEQDEDEDDSIRPSETKELVLSEQGSGSRSKELLNKQEKEDRKLARRASKEVEQFYQDPLKLADGVLKRLKIPDIEGALRLVRASETFEIKNIVSWNHCIDWYMGQGEVKQALKIYNELKKRGHMPDAGFSQHVRYPNAVKEALKVYNSIFAPNSTVLASTIHTNAIINVCARGGDLDSLWAVVARLPETGAGSPDRLTYTLILNAIREYTIREVARSADRVRTKGDDVSLAAERKLLFERAVADGRKVWEDVSVRWRRANLVIDDKLVSAMGRLLLGCGVGKDMEQVFDLVESTMNIWIPERKKRKNQTSSMDASSIEPDSASEATMSAGLTKSTEPFTNSSTLPLDDTNVYAVPGRLTLALLMEACSLHKPLNHLAPSYWHLLTNPDKKYRIKPDAANITAYLRNLRVNRASAEAFKVLSQNWPDDVAKLLYQRGPFIIALSTCARDKNNPNVFKTAQKLLKLMQDKLEENEVGMYKEKDALNDMTGEERHEYILEQKQAMKKMTDEERAEFERSKDGVQSLPVAPKALQYFVQLAMDTTVGWSEGVRGKDDGTQFERDPTKNHTMVALKTVGPLNYPLKYLVRLKVEETESNQVQRKSRIPRSSAAAKTQVAEDLPEMIGLMRIMISAYDKIVEVAERFKSIPGKAPLDEQLVAHYKSWARTYTIYMARINKKLGINNRRPQLNEVDDLPEKGEAEKDEDMVSPEIERRIRMVLGEVDEQIMDDRAQKKGFKNNFFPGERRSREPALKIHSRIQKAERDTLLNRKMEQHFPKNDYGVLNEDLEVEMGENARRAIEMQDRRRNPSTFDVLGNRADTPEALASMSAKQRYRRREELKQVDQVNTKRRKQPMIGDELGLDDENQDESRQSWSRTSTTKGDTRRAQEDVPFTSSTNETDSARQPAKGSILNRGDIKGAWQRSTTRPGRKFGNVGIANNNVQKKSPFKHNTMYN